MKIRSLRASIIQVEIYYNWQKESCKEGMDMKKIGLIVNPIAGMGGTVGLKGTDAGAHVQAMKMGAKPVTPGRTEDLLGHIQKLDEIEFLAAPGKMGAHYLEETGIKYQDIGEIGEETTAEDTIRISRQMMDQAIQLLIFVGGDGTARDIFDAVDSDIPVVAVPAGVKIFSGVFAVNAYAAAALVDAFVDGAQVSEEEVLDIDEEAYRENRLESKLYGYLMIPKDQDFIQHSKAASSQYASEIENKRDVAEWVVENMQPEILYILGPGTTVKAITDYLELSKTLLGVDALYEGKIIQEDLNENDLLKILDKYPRRRLIITPIGGNGFIFGRGNKQISPQVINRIGKENIIIVGTHEKIEDLDCFRVDTGDDKVDQELSGFMEVKWGYREARIMRVKC
jgi:predicted polyphosphate/ATP-dependent NAD kinase